MTAREVSLIADQSETAPYEDCKTAFKILTKDWCGVALVPDEDDEEEVRTWLKRASSGPQD